MRVLELETVTKYKRLLKDIGMWDDLNAGSTIHAIGDHPDYTVCGRRIGSHSKGWTRENERHINCFSCMRVLESRKRKEESR